MCERVLREERDVLTKTSVLTTYKYMSCRWYNQSQWGHCLPQTGVLVWRFIIGVHTHPATTFHHHLITVITIIMIIMIMMILMIMITIMIVKISCHNLITSETWTQTAWDDRPTVDLTVTHHICAVSALGELQMSANFWSVCHHLYWITEQLSNQASKRVVC